MSRAPRRHDRTRPSGAPAPFGCYTAARIWHSPHRKARERHDASDHSQKRRDGHGALTPETMTKDSTPETSGDGRRTTRFERTLARSTAVGAPAPRRYPREPDASLRRRRDPNNPPPAAAWRTLLRSLPRPRLERRSGPSRRESSDLAKQPGAAMRDERPQHARMKTDLRRA
jgi:hypothetical protein